jgi:glutamine synthetase
MFGRLNGIHYKKEGPVGAFVAAAAPYLAAASSVLSIAGGIKSMTAKAPKMPGLAGLAQAGREVEVTRAMPTEDAMATQEAKRRQIMASQARGGRQSTFLTDSDNEKFGS